VAAGVPVYSFWPQEKINGTWAANPVNHVAPSQYYGKLSLRPSLALLSALTVVLLPSDSLTEFVAEIFKSLGLEGFYEECVSCPPHVSFRSCRDQL
jgi:hypothetical protein